MSGDIRVNTLYKGDKDNNNNSNNNDDGDNNNEYLFPYPLVPQTVKDPAEFE